MARYLKLFRNHKNYEASRESFFIAHCIQEIHLHYSNTYYFGSDDGNPDVGDEYVLDGRYYYPLNVSDEDCFLNGMYY